MVNFTHVTCYRFVPCGSEKISLNCIQVLPNIEIINNTRGGIEGEIWERGDWGQIQVPYVHSFTMLDGFSYFLNCFSP